MRINDASNKEQSLYHDYLGWTGAKELSAPFVAFVRNANFAHATVRRKIYQADTRWQFDDANNTALPIATTNLEANTDHIPLKTEHERILRVRIKDKQGNWKTLPPKDRRDYSDDELNATGEPESYDKFGNNIFLTPTPDYAVEEGVELQFQGSVTPFTTSDTTKEPGVPSLFHRYYSLLPARDYVLQNSVPNKLQAIDTEIQRMDEDLKVFFSSRDRDEKPRFTSAPTLEIY